MGDARTAAMTSIATAGRMAATAAMPWAAATATTLATAGTNGTAAIAGVSKPQVRPYNESAEGQKQKYGCT